MNSSWKSVRLDELLVKSEEEMTLRPDETYREVTVKLWGKGVVQRREILGAEILASRRFVVHANQFILSRIDARNGAFGLIPPFLDKAVVSNDFPVFDLNTSIIHPRFLEWMSKTKQFIAICKAASEGTTNRVRLKEDKFLSTTIYIPSLEEQERIVTLLNEVALKLEDAQTLRQEANSSCENLCRSMLLDKTVTSTLTPMKNLVRLRPLDVVVSKEETYHFAGVYSFGRGVFRGQSKSGADFAYTNLTRLSTGNFVYPKLMAWEGALGIVPPECEGLVVSPEFPVFEVNESKVLPEVLDVYFRTPSVWPLLAGTSTGTNVRRRRLNPSTFLDFKIPLAPMETQQRIRDVRRKLDSLKPLQGETYAELDALLQSVLDKAFKGELV